MRPALGLFVASLLLAQDSVQPEIKVDVGLVNVAFTARDSRGRLVADLTRDEIEVLEDGVVQPVQFFGRSGDLPLQIALVLDMSGSQDRFNAEHREDLEAFARRAMTPRDRSLLVCFRNSIVIATDFTSSPAELLRGMDRFSKSKERAKMPEISPDDTRSGGSAVFDAVYATATDKLNQPDARKAIILFSDGQDNSSARDVIEAIEAAQSADALIYTVRYTEVRRGRANARTRFGITEMVRLADETGGTAFDAGRTDVAEALADVAAELRSLYDIGFATTNPKRDGTFRKLQIRSKRPGVTIRSRRGYYAR